MIGPGALAADFTLGCARGWLCSQGLESRRQLGHLPTLVVACVGGGSNAAGTFYPFVEHPEVELVGVEAGGRGAAAGEHAAPLSYGSPGILHGSFSYVMQDADVCHFLFNV